MAAMILPSGIPEKKKLLFQAKANLIIETRLRASINQYTPVINMNQLISYSPFIIDDARNIISLD
jgi:hypothetical protein